MTTHRFEKLAASLRTSELDAVILNPGPTLTYLTGLRFHLMERPVVLVFTPGQTPALILPELEMEKLRDQPFTPFPYGENPADLGHGLHGRDPIVWAGWEADRRRAEPSALLEFRYVHEAAPDSRLPRCLVGVGRAADAQGPGRGAER